MIESSQHSTSTMIDSSFKERTAYACPWSPLLVHADPQEKGKLVLVAKEWSRVRGFAGAIKGKDDLASVVAKR